MQLGERKLNGLIARQGFAERRAGFGIGDAFIDAILRRAHATGGLANAVFMDKMLRQSEPLPGRTKHRAFWHPNIGKRYARMVGRHIERPHIFFDFDTRVIGRHQKASDAARRAIVALTVANEVRGNTEEERAMVIKTRGEQARGLFADAAAQVAGGTDSGLKNAPETEAPGLPLPPR